MKIADKTISAVSLVEDALKKAKKYEDYNIFISLDEKTALKKAAEIDEKIAKGEKVGPLAGVPYALKDNFLAEEGTTTAASKMLKDFHPPITATAVKKLEEAGAIVVGRTNLDAYAHGSSTENSFFGPTLNSKDKTRVAGGSSGGSAVAVALGIVPFALGSDTGGSIRQPASFNGVYGMKPTYGRVSRYGVVAMASSTDVIGCFASTPEDTTKILDIISGLDPNDLTSISTNDEEAPIRTLGIIKEFKNDSVDPRISKTLAETVEKAKKNGIKIKEISMPTLKYALAAYYIIAPAEVASNLSRYDGIRYGLRSGSAKNLDEIYGKSRDEGFMPENKRRIMIGNFVLSSGFYDAYYLKAQKARTLIIEEYEKAFKEVDAILTPVSPNPAFKLGSKVDDPMAMYYEDVMSVPINLAGLPAVAFPTGETDDGLSLGLQLVGPKGSDKTLITMSGELAS